MKIFANFEHFCTKMSELVGGRRAKSSAVMIAFRQVMSYEMLRIVIIGFAKLKLEKAIIS